MTAARHRAAHSRRRGRVLLALLVLAPALVPILVGCSATGPDRDQVEASARAAGLRPVWVPAGDLDLLAWMTPTATSAPATGSLRVFIEGDGAAWPRPNRPPRDPTPRHPVALGLAVASAWRPVAYLARPCQYGQAAVCGVADWTNERFAPPALDRLSAALDHLKHKTGAATLWLVGYSGGAHLAARLAARRNDVAALVTVAGVLDPAQWTRHHGVSPLPALPAAEARRLAALPGVHLVGDEDDTVPPDLARQMLARHGLDQGELWVLAGQGHGCCWATRWADVEARVTMALARQSDTTRPIP